MHISLFSLTETCKYILVSFDEDNFNVATTNNFPYFVFALEVSTCMLHFFQTFQPFFRHSFYQEGSRKSDMVVCKEVESGMVVCLQTLVFFCSVDLIRLLLQYLPILACLKT